MTRLLHMYTAMTGKASDADRRRKTTAPHPWFTSVQFNLTTKGRERQTNSQGKTSQSSRTHHKKKNVKFVLRAKLESKNNKKEVGTLAKILNSFLQTGVRD